MGDWIGIAFLVLLLAGAYFGIRALANPKPRTSEDFERNAAENTTMLGASMNALNELMNPEAAKAKEVQMQMKDGRYGKKKREGKAGGPVNEDEDS
ncbi:MAG: hypothetical protein HOP17_04985 [Acidobacteria bacterium]|nr:hypothetical protein [Acidobacteriota bacterium]